SPGTPISTVDVTVTLGTNVTSRLLGNNGANNSSEALLLIDEPGAAYLPAPVQGFGSQAPQTLCVNPATGCVEYAQTVGGVPVASASASSTVPAPNIFQGLVTQNQVTFKGVPILPPGAGAQRILRIVNIRANIAGQSGSLMAFISTSNGNMPLSNSQQVAGYV